MTNVVVIGAGFAGTAAALSAARAGANVTIVDGGSGASSLWTGAIDGSADALERFSSDTDIRATLEAVDSLDVGDSPALVVTEAGLTRLADGRDRSVLDLASVAGTVLVPDIDGASWDGAAIARSLSADAGARAASGSSLTFRSVKATLTRFEGERSFSHAEMACLHDDETRLSWLGDRLRELLDVEGGAAAILLPPWLGARAPQASALSARLGVRVGEVVSGLPGSAGARFEARRDDAFARAGVRTIRGRAVRVERHRHGEDRFRVALEGDQQLLTTSVVLAMGGLLGGGIRYEPAEAIAGGAVPHAPRSPFVSTVDVPAKVGWERSTSTVPSSLFGFAPESLFATRFDDPPAIAEQVGLIALSDGRVDGEEGLFAAGDVASDRPRTVLDAWVLGALVGRRAVAR